MNELLLFLAIVAAATYLVFVSIVPNFHYAAYSMLHKLVKRNDISFAQLQWAGACSASLRDFRTLFGPSAKITLEGLTAMQAQGWSPFYLLRFYASRIEASNIADDIYHAATIELEAKGGSTSSEFKATNLRLLYERLLELK